MRTRMILALALLAGSAACELLTGPGDRLDAHDAPPNVVLVNGGDRSIYYFAIEQNAAAVTLWGPCEDPDTCDAVEAGQRREIPYSSIAGYTPDADVVLVYWWHLVPAADGGFRPDTVRVEEVPL